MISWIVALLAMAASPAPVPAAAGGLARCALPSPPAASQSAERLVVQAESARAAGDAARAETLFGQALGAQGSEVTRARAARMLIDLRLPRDDLGEIERFLACDGLRGDHWTHARAWLAYRQGRYADAVDLLAPLVRPRHHAMPRWSIVHEDLGDSFARLGRRADAQAQWRIALATNYDPGDSGWDRAALDRKLAAALAEPPGAEPMLPLQYYDDAVSILDLGSVRRTRAGVRYAKLVLLRNDEDRAAYGVDVREVDCDRPRSRVLAVQGWDAAGAPARQVEDPGSWVADRSGEPWLPTERRLVCSVEDGLALAPRRRSNLELLRAYREGRPLFE